jgi:hypothetical protein
MREHATQVGGVERCADGACSPSTRHLELQRGLRQGADASGRIVSVSRGCGGGGCMGPRRRLRHVPPCTPGAPGSAPYWSAGVCWLCALLCSVVYVYIISPVSARVLSVSVLHVLVSAPSIRGQPRGAAARDRVRCIHFERVPCSQWLVSRHIPVPCCQAAVVFNRNWLGRLQPRTWYHCLRIPMST